MATPREFVPLSIAILTVSDTRTIDTDSSGALLVERLQKAGHRLGDHQINRDDIYRIRATVSASDRRSGHRRHHHHGRHRRHWPRQHTRGHRARCSTR
jgi:molybdopterin biosynthesis enzyme MoaB